jgi:carbazole 1,9a-dioxygenase terminal dioxygenase component
MTSRDLNNREPRVSVDRSGVGFVKPEVLERVEDWRGYAEAKLGFRNHWYPVRFSNEIKEGEAVTLTLLGEAMLLKRIDGKVYAMRDRCLHRGVKFSRKLECYTQDTVTCWYHGYTYRVTNGELVTILAVPDSKLIGKCRVKTFPVTEAKGLVFVYVGDANREPAPLAQDVPPWFLDDDMMVLGIHRPVGSNWRIGAENGFDSVHIFIHRDSVLRHHRVMNFPLGHRPKTGAVRTVEDAGGPKGVFDDFADHIPAWEGVIDGEVAVRGVRAPVQGTSAAAATSMWLPCVLRVDTFPVPGITQFEWYVPIDDKSHLYVQTLGARVKTDDDRRRFTAEFESKWKPVSLYGFNDDDIWAREATEPFYADDYGWIDETLCEPDNTILAWRRLASRHNRGIQRPENLR